MRWDLTLALVAVVAGTLQFGSIASGSAQTGPVVTLATVAVDRRERTVDVDVMVSQGEGVAAFQFVLTFDPQVLAVDSIEDGDFLTSSGRQSFCVTPTIEPSAVRFACATLGIAPLATASAGRLATVHFRTRSSGTVPLALNHVKLADSLGSEIPAEAEDSTVSVVVDDRQPYRLPSWWYAGAVAVCGALGGLWWVRRSRRRRAAQATAGEASHVRWR